MIDLHTHTTASDGTMTPTQLLETAHQIGLSALAVTDHDTIAGLAEARAAADRLGIFLLPGIEVSADFEGTEIHILGYGIQADSQTLADFLVRSRQDRDDRNRRMVQRMQELGCSIDYDRLREQNPGSVLGRPHIAQALVDSGFVPDMKTAFEAWLKEGQPGYVPRVMPAPQAAVSAIQAAGGLAVLAHPRKYKFRGAKYQRLLDTAARAGVWGFEAYYSGYTPEQRAALAWEALRRGLRITGGSDFHAGRKPHIALGRGTGDLRVPEQILTALLAALDR